MVHLRYDASHLVHGECPEHDLRVVHIFRRLNPELLGRQARGGLFSEGLVRCRDMEAQASNTYFAAWSATVDCRFAERDAARVPTHWTVFAARTSPLHPGGRSPRNAADPINALHNYGYALAKKLNFRVHDLDAMVAQLRGRHRRSPA